MREDDLGLLLASLDEDFSMDLLRIIGDAEEERGQDDRAAIWRWLAEKRNTPCKETREWVWGMAFPNHAYSAYALIDHLNYDRIFPLSKYPNNRCWVGFPSRREAYLALVEALSGQGSE